MIGFLNTKIFTGDLVAPEGVMSFLYSLSPTARVRVMPDYHDGAGCIVGLTMPISDEVNPEWVGCDIGCGIRVVTSSTKIPENFRPELIDLRIRESIPMGFELNQNTQVDEQDFIRYLKKEHQKARSIRPLQVPQIDIDLDKFMDRLQIKPKAFWKSLGTLGGGNHFIEVSKTPEGCWAVVVHTGSRNLGIKVWSYWVKESKRPIKKGSSEKTGRSGMLSGENMAKYISDTIIAQAYASYNRKIITDKVMSILKAKQDEVIESVHNYIDPSDMILRKGAIKASSGRDLVVSLNMAEGVLIGTGKGVEDWNYSAPHGLGRKYSRGEARGLLTVDEYQDSMKGVFSSVINSSTLDESPMAYKDQSDVLSLLPETVDPKMILKPLVNLKSGKIEGNEESA